MDGEVRTSAGPDRQRTRTRAARRYALIARIALVPSLALVFGAALCPTPAHGQEIGRPYRVADSGDARRRIDSFERHRSAGRWEAAVKQLGRLLALAPERGLVVEVPRKTSSDLPRFEGVGGVGRRLFDDLSTEGREAWERIYRARAEKLLARGLDLRRPADLRSVARRYPARDIRRRAHEGLASLALARGDFAVATHELRQLLDVADTDTERAGILARIAFSRSQLGDREGVERVLQLSAPLLRLMVPGPEGGEPLADFIDRMLQAAGTAAGAGMGRPQFSGNEHGTALAEAPPQPDSEARWRLATAYQEGTETRNDQRNPWRTSRGPALHRPVVPAVARGVVYVNNGLRLRAVDISSGNVLWQRGTRQRLAQWRDNKLAIHTAAVADDTVYAALASRADAPDMVREFYGRIIVYRLPHRSLSAYDVRTGETLWSHEDEGLAGHPDAAEIGRESVASPPLVVGDDVLVATWTFNSSFDVRLVCFDRHTGRTRWRRSIAQGQQELNLFGRPVKELATTALAELDGVVYLSSGLGIAAGVRVTDGEINWLTSYPQIPIPPSRYWYETTERAVTWWPSPVVATRRNVIMAPLESPYLVAFDPRTGAISWRVHHRRRPFDFHYFLGVSGDRAFVLGDRLAALDISTGARSWTSRDAGKLVTSDQSEGAAVGRGVLTPEFAFVPTEDSIEVLRLSDGGTESQWVLPETRQRERSGDLTSADGALLLTTRGSVTAHYRFEDRRDRLLARIAQSPDDPRLRLETGEIFRGAGRLDDAVSSLEIGMKLLDGLAPRAREGLEGPLRSALFAAYTQRAGESIRSGDANRTVADLERAVAVTDDRGNAVRALLALAAATRGHTALVARGRDALRRVRDDFPEVHVTLSQIGRVHAGAHAAMLLADELLREGDVEGAVAGWLDVLERHADADLGRTDVRGAVAARIAKTRRKHAKTVTEIVRKRARRAFDAARNARDPAALDRVARTYPDPRTQADAALLAAELHAGRGDARRSVAILRALLSIGPEPADAARALWKLADAYRSLDEPGAERMALQRLAREHPTADLGGQPSEQLVAARLTEPRLAAPEVDLPAPEPPLPMLWERGGASLDDGVPQIIVLDGRRPSSLDGRLVALRLGVLELLDAATGRPLWRTPTGVETRTVTGTNNALVVVGDDRRQGRLDVAIRSFSADDGTARWTRRLAGGYRASARGLGVLYIMHFERETRGVAKYVLSAVDLESGDVLAVREFAEQLFPDVVVAEDAVIVFRKGSDPQAVPRTVVTLDGTSLALRGTTPLDDDPFDNVAVHAEGAGVVVTLHDASTLVAVDVGTGAERWRYPLPGAEVKSYHAVQGGVIVADSNDQLIRLNGTDGARVWAADLSGHGGLGWQGLAVADGLIAATLVPAGAKGSALAVALSAESGDVLWRHTIEWEQTSTAHPHPVICRQYVAYEVNERFGNNAYRSRVLLLDRASGDERLAIAHPSIGKRWQRVVYDRGYVGLTVPGELAIYGPK